MILSCTNKGCYETAEHLLSTAAEDGPDGTVFCIKCSGKINVPRPTLHVLKSLGQIQRKVKSGIQIACKKCSNVDRPLLKTSGKATKAFCRKCDQPLDVHPSFIQAMKVIKEDYTGKNNDNGSGKD